MMEFGTLLDKVAKQSPQNKADVERLLVELADTDDLRVRLTRIINSINGEADQPLADNSDLQFPCISRDWEEDKEHTVQREILNFRNRDDLHSNPITLDFCDPLLWSSVTAWTCLKYAITVRLSSTEYPRFVFPKWLEFINTKLATQTKSGIGSTVWHKSQSVSLDPPVAQTRLAVMRWRLYHNKSFCMPRVAGEDERRLARDFAMRLGERDEATIARQVVEGDFRQWLANTLSP